MSKAHTKERSAPVSVPALCDDPRFLDLLLRMNLNPEK